MPSFLSGGGSTQISGEFQSSSSGYIHKQSFGVAASAQVAYVHAAITMPAAGSTVVTTAITNPDIPRILTLKGNQASVTGNATIAGTDIRGAVISEVVALNGTATIPSIKAFKTVTSITIPQRGAGGDSVQVGIGVALGLNRLVTDQIIIAAIINNLIDSGGACQFTNSSSTTISLNTVTFATPPDDAGSYSLYYISQELSTLT